jgi:hypothetical protein
MFRDWLRNIRRHPGGRRGRAGTGRNGNRNVLPGVQVWLVFSVEDCSPLRIRSYFKVVQFDLAYDHLKAHWKEAGGIPEQQGLELVANAARLSRCSQFLWRI